MAWLERSAGRRWFVARVPAGLLILAGAADGRQGPPKVLRIGTSGTLGAGNTPAREKAALRTLRDFIKEETGLNNQILRQKSWRQLADRMARGELHLG